MWENMAQLDWSRDNIARRVRFVCWIAKATDTHLKYVILMAFLRQPILRDRTSMLLLYLGCLSCLVLSVVELWLKHNWVHRLKINRTQRSVRLVCYATWKHRHSRLSKVCDERMDNSKTAHRFGMLKTCSLSEVLRRESDSWWRRCAVIHRHTHGRTDYSHRSTPRTRVAAQDKDWTVSKQHCCVTLRASHPDKFKTGWDGFVPAALQGRDVHCILFE
jgi:hypothetical protein